MNDPFPRIRQLDNGIFVECDKDMIAGLIEVLQHLLSMARVMKMKDRAIRAEAQIMLEKEKARAAIAYKDIAEQVLQTYDDALASGIGKDGALRKVKADYELSAVDARGYVAEGRRMRKQAAASVSVRRSRPGRC